MFHSFHWPLDVKQLTSFMWRKGVYFMPCIDTKYFISFLLCLPIIRCFTHDWKKACMWWLWKRDWPFAPLAVVKRVAFLSWQKKMQLQLLDVFRFTNIHAACALIQATIMLIAYDCYSLHQRKYDQHIILWLRPREILTLSAPISTYKFSRLISIHFLKELVERIW